MPGSARITSRCWHSGTPSPPPGASGSEGPTARPAAVVSPMLAVVERVAVLDRDGAGKTTTAAQLGTTGLPVSSSTSTSARPTSHPRRATPGLACRTTSPPPTVDSGRATLGPYDVLA